MTFTDQDILTEIQGLLVEDENAGVSWSSGMWSADEVVGYLDDAQQNLITMTGLRLTRATLPCTPGVSAQALPQDWIVTVRLVWVRASDGRRYVLRRADSWELDTALPDWRTADGPPNHYSDADAQTLAVLLAPAPSSAGTLQIVYVALPTGFTGAGVAAEVPDECAPGLTWGAIGKMLTKEGRAKDAARAQAATQLEDLTVEAVKAMLRGWGG